MSRVINNFDGSTVVDNAGLPFDGNAKELLPGGCRKVVSGNTSTQIF